MTEATRRTFALGCGVLATSVAYLVVTAGHVPLLVYLPLEGRWTFSPPPSAISMDWYFRAGVSLIAGALGGASGAAISNRVNERTARTVAGLAFAALFWAALFTAFAVVGTRVASAGAG